MTLVFWGLRLAAWSGDLLLEACGLQLEAFYVPRGARHNILDDATLVFSVTYIRYIFIPAISTLATLATL